VRVQVKFNYRERMNRIPGPVKLIIKIILSVAFFSVLLSFVQGNELLELCSRINWVFFILSFVVTVVMVAASCAKWKLILDLKDDIPYRELFRIYMVGYFFSNILPSTVGGDVIRSYYAGRLIENQGYAAVSVFVERFSGIFFLFFLVTVAPLFKTGLYLRPSILFPALAGGCFAMITIWVWKAKNPFALPDRIARFCLALLRKTGDVPFLGFLKRVADSLERLYSGIIDRLKKLRKELDVAVDAVKENKRFLRRLISLTVLFYLLTWVNVYTAFRAFDVHVDFLAICAIVPAIMLVAHVPVTLLGNLGYFESVFVFYFLLVGVGGAESLAMGLLLRLKMLFMGAIGYIVYLTYRQKFVPDSADSLKSSENKEV